MEYIGELAALATALCWAFTSTSFEAAGRQIGSLNLNLTRLLIGLVFLSLFTLLTRGLPLPTDANAEQWLWLALSGVVGVVIGDLLLFEGFLRIGSRVSMLIYASVPIFAGLFSWLLLGERMTTIEILGMVVTIAGISLVIFRKANTADSQHIYSKSGIALAFGGAICQALGYIIGKKGTLNYDPFAATQIRIIAGIIGFIIVFTLVGNWPKYLSTLKIKAAYPPLIIGSFFGPFLGISLSLFAVQRINPGVASTLIALTPVLLIPYAYFGKREVIGLRDIVGTCIAVIGVAIIFML